MGAAAAAARQWDRAARCASGPETDTLALMERFADHCRVPFSPQHAPTRAATQMDLHHGPEVCPANTTNGGTRNSICSLDGSTLECRWPVYKHPSSALW